MKRTKFGNRNRRPPLAMSNGKVLVVVALCLSVLFGIVACALDVGWVMMTRTQLQAGSDAASLAGGTELLPGLGAKAYKTPSDVKSAASARAVEFAALHYAGDSPKIHVDAARDIRLGKASMSKGVWQFAWDETPYNAVQVTTRRSVSGSSSGDGPLPLIIAPIIGHKFSNVEAVSTAVIMPSKGIHIPPGSGIKSLLSPFAFKTTDFEKYKRAQAHFTSVLGSDPSKISKDIMDEATTPQLPLYFAVDISGNKVTYRQLYNDRYGVIDPKKFDSTNVIVKPDGTLEISIYPTDPGSSGNFGTIDIGGLDNSTNVLKRQIEFGPNEKDMSYYDNNQIDFSSPFVVQGETGLSSGIENAVEDITGQCRVVMLFDEISGSGNTATFVIVNIFGVRFMNVDLKGKNKTLTIQPCVVKDSGGLPDLDDDDGTDDTVFSPLILAQ